MIQFTASQGIVPAVWTTWSLDVRLLDQTAITFDVGGQGDGLGDDNNEIGDGDGDAAKSRTDAILDQLPHIADIVILGN